MTSQPEAQLESNVVESIEERNARCTQAVQNLLKAKLGDDSLSDTDLKNYDRGFWMKQNLTSLSMPPESFRTSFYYTQGGLENGVIWENKVDELVEYIKQQRSIQDADIRPSVERILDEKKS